MNLGTATVHPPRIYTADGWRVIPPSERSPGMTELKLPGGRCIAATGCGPDVERAIMEHASNV